MKNRNKKIFFIVIGVVLGIILIGGITYAWYSWRSNSSIYVSISVDDSIVNFYYDGGANITGDLEPTLTKEEGIVKTFTAYSNNNSVYIDFWLKVNTLPTELKDETFKWEMWQNGNIVGEGNFAGYTSGDIKIADLVKVSNSSSNSTFTLYLWIDGNVVNNYEMAGKSIDFDVYAGAGIYSRKPAAEYITNLYTNASKSTATVNSITYNLAPSVGLMNDRKGSSSVGANAGNIRYYGASPNNYVWLGDYYTSDVTFEGNITGDGYSTKEECIEENYELYCTEDIVRRTGDKKLWRIIGVFDGKLKLITADPITTQGLSWDTSAYGVNLGGGINQWGPSNSYEGADLMRLLNSGYESDSINNSLYWTKGTGTLYTGSSDATTANISFANTGLSQSEKDKIDTAVWFLGAYNDKASYVNVQYAAERQSATLGKICSGGTFCNDIVERTSTWNGKVGLMYPSDFGYATDLSQCNHTLSDYLETGCASTDWLRPSNTWEWTISPRAYSSNATSVVGLRSDNADSGSAGDGKPVRPAVYLKSGVTISSGNGTESDPYVLN